VSVWLWASVAWAGEERAPHSATWRAECNCVRLVYDDGHQVDVPMANVESVLVHERPDGLHEIALHTAGEDVVVYRAPCLLARDFGLRFATNGGFTLTGADPASMCLDSASSDVAEWRESVQDFTMVSGLALSLVELEASGSGGPRLDVQRNLSAQRGTLAHCFTEEHARGAGSYKLVFGQTGAVATARTMHTTGSDAVDACITDTFMAVPGPVGDGRGRARVDVAFAPPVPQPR
jgi:hypothetical protein